ncbi:ATP/GTP-binding protein, partial [Clavibacter phaseoli]
PPATLSGAAARTGAGRRVRQAGRIRIRTPSVPPPPRSPCPRRSRPAHPAPSASAGGR